MARNLEELVEIHRNGLVSDNIIIRQLYYLLSMPVMLDYQHSAVLHPNVLHLTLFDREHQHMLDSLLRLMSYSREQKLSDLVVNFQCFEQIFEVVSKEGTKFLSKGAFIINN